MFEINGVQFLNEGEQVDSYLAKKDEEGFRSYADRERSHSRGSRILNKRITGSPKEQESLKNAKDFVEKHGIHHSGYRDNHKQDERYSTAISTKMRHDRRHKNESFIFESVSFLND